MCVRVCLSVHVPVNVRVRVCVCLHECVYAQKGGLSPDTSCSVFWKVSGPPKRKE